MNRALLLKAAGLAETAATYATITASHSNIKPETAARWAADAEAALCLALDALAEAQRMPAPAPKVHPLFAEIIQIMAPAEKAA